MRVWVEFKISSVVW